jgi:hypothetical protein
MASQYAAAACFSIARCCFSVLFEIHSVMPASLQSLVITATTFAGSSFLLSSRAQPALAPVLLPSPLTLLVWLSWPLCAAVLLLFVLLLLLFVLLILSLLLLVLLQRVLLLLVVVLLLVFWFRL